jgi:C-terminal duplication domain of Friend of PRMT1
MQLYYNNDALTGFYSPILSGRGVGGRRGGPRRGRGGRRQDNDRSAKTAEDLDAEMEVG